MIEKTNIFIRIQREGKWINIDMLDATPIELQEFMEKKEKEEILQWFQVIVGMLRAASGL